MPKEKNLIKLGSSQISNFDSVSHWNVMSLEQEHSRRVGGDVR